MLCYPVKKSFTRGGIIYGGKKEELYVVAIATGCKNFENIKVGDIIMPALPPGGGRIDFQTVNDDNDVNFVLIYDSEIAAVQHNTVGFEWIK
jgi:hypothetical protein